MTTTDTSLVVFTRDLRVRDHPALHAGSHAADRVVTLFVLDDDVLRTWHANPNRLGFLLESLDDLRVSVRDLGGELVIRRGDWVQQVAAVAREIDARSVHLSADVSAFATRRVERLAEALPDDVELHQHPCVTVVPPGSTHPSSGGAWKVFTPYHRRWLDTPWRSVHRAPSSLRPPAATAQGGIEPGEIPALSELSDAERSPDVMPGGETEGLARLKKWAASSLERYEDQHNALADDDTSRISPYLHFGCLSPLEVATRLRSRPGGAAFVRQLAWRDFYHQALASQPDAAHADYRPRGDVWREDPDDFAAWSEGRTGYPIVDAAMAQLRLEGFMHNRARMIVASFLTKDLYLDWRLGAEHFMRHLLDGDVANNQLNWQWTAGTGSDTNPNRIFNPTVQSTRFDPDGEYIRRYLPALKDVPAPMIHDPDQTTRRATGYPDPIVDHAEAITAYRAQLASYRAD